MVKVRHPAPRGFGAKDQIVTGAWSFAPTADEKLRITDAEADGQAAVMFLSFWDKDSRQGVVGFGSSGDERLRIRTDAATAGIYLLPGDSILDLDGVIRMKQRGNALADVDNYGQWWVKNDTPTVPRFTDDAGLDGILAQLNLTQTVSGAWTHSGITTFTADIVAGTIDADFDAITATSYGNIAEANLVDKSAAESIAAKWTFNANIDLAAGGSIGVPNGRVHMERVSLADDATGIVDVGVRALVIVSSGFNADANLAAFITGQQTPNFLNTLGAFASYGDSANPDVDGDANYWKDDNDNLHIKNRLGSSRPFFVISFEVI